MSPKHSLSKRKQCWTLGRLCPTQSRQRSLIVFVFDSSLRGFFRSPSLQSSEERIPSRSLRSPPSRSDHSIRALDSISLLSLSDQATLNSMHGPSASKRAVIPSSISVIERNARIIKWLFQLHQANSSPAFIDSSSSNVVNNSEWRLRRATQQRSALILWWTFS